MSRRGQSNLLSVAVAVVLLVTATGLAVAVADDALVRADRDPVARHAAAATADRLVANASPTTRRANVLRGARAANLTAADVDALSPPARGYPLVVRLDGRTLLARGSPAGPTVRRHVRVARTERVRATYVANGTRIAVPAGVDRVDVRVRSGANTTLSTLRADGRIVLHDPNGLAGTATVRLSPYGPTTLRAPTTGNATVRVAYDRVRTRPATLEVRVGAR
ncbi:MAG: hypothetical protein ABEJ43_01835 [Haloferacaceae archaeon]